MDTLTPAAVIPPQDPFLASLAEDRSRPGRRGIPATAMYPVVDAASALAPVTLESMRVILAAVR